MLKRALISVSDKTGIVELAKKLISYKVEIISTGGTAKVLTDAGIKVTNISVITNFQECVDAGYAIREIYPAQCVTEDGEVFVEEVEDLEENEYYGSSTRYPCEEHGDCVEAGCNSEICTGVDEGGMASICLFPEEPLPRDLGYTCGCFENKCQWAKD